MNKYFSRLLLVFAIALVSIPSMAAGGPPQPSSMSNPFVMTMVILMAVLALAIALLSYVVIGAAQVRREKEKTREKPKTATASIPATAALIAGLLFCVSPAFAQTQPAAAVTTNGISDTAFYLMASVIFLELIIILALLFNLRRLIASDKENLAAKEGVPAKPRISWWDRFNKLRPIEQEVTIDLGHNYDGIRELDNRLPPWWLYGFYITIVFAGIYLWRYHVSHTAPLPGEELQIAMKAADAEKQEYLKKAGNMVDENTVKLLSNTADIDAGKIIFQTTCFPCHGKNGEGLVGPNLTDDYWLHGATLNDVFKTIKYGYPEKGMKSWKDDYTPLQIAQLASFIKSIAHTNPANPKAPQGNLSIETNIKAAVDSAGTKAKDSTKTAAL